MAQLTIYLPDALEAKARKLAKARRESVSRWIASQVQRSLSDTWPQQVLDAAGAFPDFPELHQIRKGYGKDSPRERIE
jgi:predicted transcriptional regulator